MHAARDLAANTHGHAHADTDTDTDTDVIVVGAGPTGLLLGAELALGGVRVQILERRATAQRDSRALTLHPRSIELMDQRGLVERFLAHGRRVPGWHFAGLDTRLDFSALDTRHGYTLFLAQARTEQLLAERASELDVPVRRGYEVVGLRRNPGGGGVTGGRGITGGRGGGESDEAGVEVDVRGPDGTLETVRARYVVGCDGGRSVVRRAAGIGFPGTDETLSGALGDFATVDPAALDRARAHGVLAVPLEPAPRPGPALRADGREAAPPGSSSWIHSACGPRPPNHWHSTSSGPPCDGSAEPTAEWRSPAGCRGSATPPVSRPLTVPGASCWPAMPPISTSRRPARVSTPGCRTR